jgi:type II secretory pathway pseudopilin PulG
VTEREASPRWRDEHGSLPLVLLAAIVLGGLIVVVFGDVSTGQRTARQDRDYNAAIQVADAAMQEAFTDLAAYDPADTSTPVGGVRTGSGVLQDGSEYSWEANRVGRVRWQVRAEGRYRDATRYLEADIGPSEIFALAAFADLKLELRGANLADSYNHLTFGTGNGSVGSNNEIVLRGNATVDWVYRYNAAAYNNGGIVLNDVFVIDDEVPLPNYAEQAYADGGICAGQTLVAYTGQFPLQRGETYCFTNVTFPAGDHLLVDNSTDPNLNDEPTRIYIAPSGNLELRGQGNTRCSGVSCVNWEPRDRPNATALEIYLASGEVLANNHTVIAAGIWAPTSNCSGPNAQGDIYGAIVCRTLDSKGGWNFHYDDRFGQVNREDFAITGLREELANTSTFGLAD